MTAPPTTIEDQIASIILAESDLDDLKAVFRGMAYRVPMQYWPYAEVIIFTETTVRELTGNKHERAYSGVIFVRVSYQDIVAVSSRTARIPSFELLHTYVDDIVTLFKEAANRSLQNLAVANGAVDRIDVGTDQIDYNIGQAPGYERTETFANEGTVPFTVYTWESL